MIKHEKGKDMKAHNLSEQTENNANVKCNVHVVVENIVSEVQI